MDILDVNTSSFPKQTWVSRIIQKVIGVILWPFVMIFALLVFLVTPIIDFVLRKIVGHQGELLPDPQKDVLYKDKSLAIIREPINYGVDQLAEDFQFSIVDFSEDMEVYRLKLNPDRGALQDAIVTGLYIDLDDELILQRIINKDGSPSSELIGINKQSKEIRMYKQIGLYDLYEFNPATKEIVGASRTEHIRIKIK